MKKALTILLALAAVSCTWNQGERNACQFVREKAGVLANNIKSIEVTGQDSAIVLIFDNVTISRRTKEVLSLAADGKISADDVQAYRAFLDTMMQRYNDAMYSWQGSILVADSVRDTHSWRQVYTVKVTMRSGDTKTTRVLMDRDRITPRLLEREAIRELDEIGTSIVEGYDYVASMYDHLTRKLSR